MYARVLRSRIAADDRALRASRKDNAGVATGAAVASAVVASFAAVIIFLLIERHRLKKALAVQSSR